MTRLTTFVNRHRLLSAVALVAFAGVAALIVVFAASAPAASGVEASACVETNGACIHFPSVIGTNLNGRETALPEDFAGAVNFVVLSFEEEQTARAAAWLPVAQEMAAEYPGFAFYSVPVLPSVNAIIRGFIMSGMLVLIPDESNREITVMLFLDDIDALLSALAIPDRAALQLFLVNADGSIHWRTAGDYTDAAANALRIVVARAMR